MDFALSEEQQLIVDTTRAFVENELYPHEAEVERTGHLRMDLIKELQAKAIEAGLYAANMPEEVGGAGLDTLTWLLYEKELGRANYALHWTCVARPSNILLAGTDEQKEKYLYPCIRGETWDCLAMTEPGAGSDLRGMKATARQDGDDWVLNGTKHFISHADIAGFAIVFMASRRGGYAARKAQEDHRLLRRQGHARLHRARRLPQRFASRLHQLDPRIRRCSPACFAGIGRTASGLRGGQLLARRNPAAGRGHVDRPRRTGLLPCRRMVGAAQAVRPADRQVPGRVLQARRHGDGTEGGQPDAAWKPAWKYDQGTVTDEDMAMAKLKATEMLAFVADEAIQIHGGMGLMDELPLERIWRDARVERIWEGTSEIQRHIISRQLLRPLGA